MPKEAAEKAILKALEARAAEHDVDVVDVEVVGASKAPCVRVRIDHADEDAPTISLDEVAAQSTWISEVLDELDPIAGPFTLEVSSPGLARPLRRPRDFARFAGQSVSLTTTAASGRRRYTGVLLGIEGTTVSLDCDSEQVDLDLDDIKKCTIKPDFSALGATQSK